MARTKAAPKAKQPEKAPAIPENISAKLPWIFLAVLLIIVIFLYEPIILKGMEPSGADVVTGIGKTHQLRMWEKQLGHYPLWNPFMFGGMPTYHRHGPVAWSVDTILSKMDFLGDWRLYYFLLGAVGMYLLVVFLGLSPITAILAGLAFVLMPHFQALIIVGHYAKFRALMWMPYVVLTTLFFIRRKDLLSMLLFTLAVALQFRTQHYQIMFYTILFSLFLGLPPLIKDIREKQFPKLARFAGLFAISAVLILLVISQNLLSIKEYTPHSTRGGHAISLQENAEKTADKKGVGFEYATNWSYSVSELWNLIVPKFHGGTSQEEYQGNAVPAWRNQLLPTYWGSMPFTQSYEYLGIILVYLALLGIVTQWKRSEVKALTFLTLLALLLALGKNFDALYRLFFYYIPYFDKFRVPMMILTLVMGTVSLLAAFGLHSALSGELFKAEYFRKFLVISGGLAALLLIPLLFGSAFSLSKAGEVQRYGQQVVAQLKVVRAEMLKSSAFSSLLFLLLGFGSLMAIYKKWISGTVAGLLVIVFLLIDLTILDAHYIDNKFTDPKQAEIQQYAESQIDRVLKQDKSLYRVFPVGQLFQDTRWCYRYQSIGGYSPAKLQTIQELVDNNLMVAVSGRIPINWNVVDMLNGKYLIANQPLPGPRLKPVASDEQQRLYVYENSGVLPRAFFVGKTEVIPDGVKRLRRLNQPDFNPARIAILEKPLTERISTPDSSRAVIEEYQPEKIRLKVFTDKTALLVLSEMYYPEGWKAYLDGKTELEIYKTNHAIRSVVVPAGEHNIEFRFHPQSFYTGARISMASLYLIYLLLAGLLFTRYRQAKAGKTE